MVIKKRNPTNNIPPEIKEEKKKFPPKFGEIQIKTWAEEVVEVLNILESKGINIYNENRYGGMYLKGNKKIKIFPTKKEQEPEPEPALQNLFELFKNKQTK